MRFAAKMALSMLALLGVLFAAGGYFMIWQNFEAALQTAVQQNINLHTQQKYTLKMSLIQTAEKEGLQDYIVAQAGETLSKIAAPSNGSCAILSKGYASFFNGLPTEIPKMQQISTIEAGEESYLFYQKDHTVYQMMASNVIVSTQSVWLVNAFDVSAIYAGRTAQLQLFWKLYCALIAAAALLSALVAGLLTRPLKKLNAASRRIAEGAYNQRIDSVRTDEIGQLSNSFDDMAAAVEEKVHSLELSVRQREDFVGAFTHELKTPMTAMLGYAALLEKGAGTPEMHEKAIRYIHSETKRLEVLSQKLLLLLGLSDESIALCNITLSEIFEKVQQALAAQDAYTVVLPQTNGERVCADSDLIVDLIYNLVQNAIHAQPKDGKVEISYEIAQNCCIISVHDTGKGIPSQQLSRITEPFYCVDKSRSRAENGSGLGLSICARIAALHGAPLAIESTEHVGTTVRFTLKLQEVATCE